MLNPTHSLLKTDSGVLAESMEKSNICKADNVICGWHHIGSSQLRTNVDSLV